MKFLVIIDYYTYFEGEGYDPLGVLYIVSSVRSAGHEVMMVEDNFEKASQLISEWAPDFVGYSVYTGNHKSLISLNLKLKEKHDFISIFGGPHPTFFPEMIEEEGVDIVCRGEGEEAVVELMNLAEKGQNYGEVNNFWVKQNGRIHMNNVRPLEGDLDKIDFPARDVFYQFPAARDRKSRVLITARGCPYACTYCYVPKIKELYKDCGVKYFRHRSVDSVIQEILGIKEKYPLEFVHFSTDNFTAKKKWVLEFSEKYRKEINLPFNCLTRPETTNPEVCRALKEARCQAVILGIESGSEWVRYELLNRRMTDKQIIDAARNIRDAGIRVQTFNMMNYPGETLDQAYETIRINQEGKVDLASCSLFFPFPRTKLTDYAVEHGYFDGNFDQMPQRWTISTPIKNPKIKRFVRLYKLFGIAVEFPWLMPLIKVGIRLPLKPLYGFMGSFHWQYRYRFRILDEKLTMGKFIKFFFKQVTKYFIK